MLVGAATGAWFAAIAADEHLVRANVVASVAALTVLAAGLALRLPVTVPAAIAILGAEYVAILGFCFANRSVRGMTLIAIGVALNVLVIALNQGMPTKDDVRERDGREVHVPIEQTVKHRPQEDDDVLGFLGDVITAPGFPNQQFSIGDIVMGLGIVDLCFEGSRVPRRRGVARATRRAQTS